MAPDLNEEVEVVVQDSDVITVPIDDTLSNSGEAADAKAVGDALALKADRSELSAAITVNGQGADSQGVIIVTGADTKISSTDNTTLKAAIEAVDGKTAADIKMSSAAGANTIAQEISEIGDMTAEDIVMAEGSTTTVAQKLGAMENVEAQNSNDIAALKVKTGADISVSAIDDTKISEALNARVKTVNGNTPDASGNVQVEHTLTADNMTSNQSHTVTGEFARRTSGGDASINTGDAWLSIIRGNRTHVGYVPESLTMTVTTAPREQGETPITATIDRDTFVEAVSGSTTVNLTYTTSWSADPATYGVTVTGDPVSGDQITIAYTAEDRGTIIQSDPQAFISTGWNLYNHTAGYAIGLKYADTAQFRIGGNYTAVKFSSTIDGAKTTITPSDGLFTISANGYIWVEGGDTTTTYVFMTWTDWVLSTDIPAFEAYSESEIDLSVLMAAHFDYGLMRVGDVRDEINFNTGIATSNVQRLSYSAENLEAAEASGLTYEYDTNYIYLERSEPVEYDLDEYDLDGMYHADDHGLEYFTNTSIADYAICTYGNNLKNKLERDVLTISQQTLNSTQKAQVLTNIGAAAAADLGSKSSASSVTGDDAFSKINSLNSKITFELISSGSILTHAESLVSAGGSDMFYATSGTTGRPIGAGGGYIIAYRYIESQNSYLKVIFYESSTNKVFINTKWSNGWIGWEEFEFNSNTILTKKTYTITVVATTSAPLGYYGSRNIQSDINAYGEPVSIYGFDKNGYATPVSYGNNNSIGVCARVEGDCSVTVIFSKHTTTI